jgi:hypothetical protein
MSESWILVHRSLDHKFTKAKCANKQLLIRFPLSVKDFAACFDTMQGKRHEADYNPNWLVSTSAIDSDIEAATGAIADFRAAPQAHRREFCAYVLFKPRAG